jgi:membrane-bound acyltransferase YfiQ involved in biofilm formation
MVRRLLYLNGLAVLGVILYHSSAWGFISMFWWTDRYSAVAVPNFERLGSLPYFALRGIEQLIIFSIPSFLFVSGFFIAFATGKYQETVGWNVILNRLKTLIIPYLIWSVAILVAKMIQGQQYSPLEVVEILLTGQAEPPYYYVPVLVQLYILSPIMVPFARNRWKPLLVLAGLIQLVTVALRYSFILNVWFLGRSILEIFTQSWLFPGYIFFFVLGMVVGFQLPKFKLWLQRYRWVFLGGLISFFTLGMIEWEALLHSSGQPWIAPSETVIDNLYAAMFLLSFLAFSEIRLPLGNKLANLGSKSFGIYLVHSPVIEYTARSIYHFAPFILSVQILFQPILWVAGLGVPLLLMAIVDRSPFRRFYSYLFG